ncbi:MAG: PAS domain-containing sensor histidine kinase, partial [Bacteroidota bacterium]
LKIVHKDDIPAFEVAIKKHYKTKEPLEIECRFLKKDGTFLEVLDTAQSEWDADGNVIRMVGSVVDITDRKNVERRMKQQNAMLEKTNEELDRFVYIASHDLRAPLSSVLGLLQVAEMSSDPKELAQCLQMIEERIVTLNGFIRDIIDYSRNTRLEVSNEPIELKKMTESIIEGLKFFEKSQSIKFECDFPDELEIHLDKGRLKIILNNLIANAIKYHDTSNNEAYIKVKARLTDHNLKIEVEDNGVGISEEYVGKIFNMFYRASEKSEGSGLGLYITKEMVEKLNGKILVESKEGVGSKFILSFPKRLTADTAN